MLKEQLPPETEDTRPQSGDSKLGDRILLWCFLASILINLGFGLWLNYADIYGEKRQADNNRVMKIATYKPPIKRKPKPKPPKIIPPKIIPKIVHKLPPPRPTPPKAPPQHFTVGHHSTSKTAIVVEAPPPPVDNTPVQPVAPDNTTVQQAPPAPPAPTPSVKYEPPVQAPPAPPAHKTAPPAPKPQPKPEPPRHPPNYLPDVDIRQATLDENSIKPPDTSSMDTSSFTGPCIVSFEVSETGRISHARVKKSSGNHEFDNACVDAVQAGHGTPAVQDHVPVGGATGEWAFST